MTRSGPPLRLSVYFAADAAAAVAVALGIVWGALVALGAFALEAPWTLAVGLDGAAVALPDALGCALPFAIGMRVLAWRESGELAAVQAAGVSVAATAGVGVLLAALPFVALVPQLVHTARPAALGTLVDDRLTALRADASAVLPELARHGVAARADADGHDFAALATLGDTVVGVRCAAVAFDGRRLDLRDGAAEWVATDVAAAPGRARFAVARFDVPPWSRPLAERSEAELPSALLTRRADDWVRGRVVRGRADARTLLERERWRRALWPWALVLGCLCAAWPLARRDGARTWSVAAAAALGTAALPGVIVALQAPRLLADWIVGGGP